MPHPGSAVFRVVYILRFCSCQGRIVLYYTAAGATAEAADGEAAAVGVLHA